MTAFPIEPEIERDGWGRPLVIPLEGGKRIGYTRCTTYVGCLDDTFKLGQWQQRMVAAGLTTRDDLRLAMSSIVPDLLVPEPTKTTKDAANDICDRAREAAAASAKATTGTALHKITERLDRGLTMGLIPPEYRADVDAYARATEPLTAVHIERFMVHDELKIGGTPDRIVELNGRHYIADLKTGSVDFAALKIAMQLSVYAHSRLYDVKSGKRSDIKLDQQRAIVIHAPAGKGTCRLLWADIEAGWRAVDVATRVRAARAAGRRMLSPAELSVDQPLPLAESSVDTDSHAPAPNAPDRGTERLAALRNEVAAAPTQKRLVELWQLNQELWSDELTQIAAVRKALLTEKGSAA